MCLVNSMQTFVKLSGRECAVYRKKLRHAGVGMPAEAPQPLDFRSPERIKKLVAYSTDDGSASLRSIYGLQTHPGVHCVRIPSVRVWFTYSPPTARRRC
jgi:hypothetical protein